MITNLYVLSELIACLIWMGCKLAERRFGPRRMIRVLNALDCYPCRVSLQQISSYFILSVTPAYRLEQDDALFNEEGCV